MEEVARKGKVIINWNGKNVTTELSRFLSSVTYTDKEEMESDEVSILLDNGEGLWSGSWYPEEGDTLKLDMGYDDAMVNCGEFQVDELVYSGPPDTVEIKAIAAGITKALRTRNSKAFEKLTLRQIAQYFCTKHGLKIVDESGMLSKINLDRKTQEEKTDLAFLSELAAEYGFIFSVRGNKMVFTSYYDLDNAESVKSIDLKTLSSYSLKEKTYDTYQSAKLSRRDSKTSTLVEIKVDDETKGNKNDELLISSNASTKKEAELKVKAGLWRKNKYRQTGSFNMPGDANMVSGVNFDLTRALNMSGKYHIIVSTHTISGDGDYTTSIEVRKCGSIPKPKSVPPVEEEKAEYDTNESDYTNKAGSSH